jgi:hypothetical protein
MMLEVDKHLLVKSTSSSRLFILGLYNVYDIDLGKLYHVSGLRHSSLLQIIHHLRREALGGCLPNI